MTVITTTPELTSLCARLSKAEFITVDTEFMRESTYFPELCLIQVADDTEAVAIDPQSENLDLAPFLALMADTNVLKVFHACRQDLEIFVQLMDDVPAPIFDTQVAAMVCGFGESVGYETLVNSLTNASIDKSARYTDWSRRPLTERQVTYALSDVTHLRDIYRHLSEQLASRRREDWVSEEMALLTSLDIYKLDPREVWRKLKPRTSKPRFLGILQEVAAWREEEAIRRNMPRRRIIKDEALLEVAASAPKTEGSLDKVRGLNGGFARSKAGQSLLKAVAAGLARPDDDLPVSKQNKPRAQTPPMAELLKVLLKIKCQQAGVAPKMIANANDIEMWAAGAFPDFPAMSGWRYKIFGKDAERLMTGDLALTANQGQIEIVELEPEEA